MKKFTLKLAKLDRSLDTQQIGKVLQETVYETNSSEQTNTTHDTPNPTAASWPSVQPDGVTSAATVAIASTDVNDRVPAKGKESKVTGPEQDTGHPGQLITERPLLRASYH